MLMANENPIYYQKNKKILMCPRVEQKRKLEKFSNIAIRKYTKVNIKVKKLQIKRKDY